MALGVVADVDENLGRTRRKHDLVEQSARARALLVDLDRPARAAVRVPDRVGAAFCDPRQERLRSERPLHGAGAAQAVSGDATHGS